MALISSTLQVFLYLTTHCMFSFKRSMESPQGALTKIEILPNIAWYSHRRCTGWTSIVTSTNLQWTLHIITVFFWNPCNFISARELVHQHFHPASYQSKDHQPFQGIVRYSLPILHCYQHLSLCRHIQHWTGTPYQYISSLLLPKYHRDHCYWAAY